MNTSGSEDFISVPLSENLIKELIQRNPSSSLRSFIEDIVSDYLERTSDKDEINELEQTGIKWGRVYLPSGTRLMMEYKGKQNFATVSNGQITYKEQVFTSASRLANHLANGTSRNAWRDFWIKRPSDKEWIQADHLRLKVERDNMIDLDQLFRK